jgi:hypothetical protein
VAQTSVAVPAGLILPNNEIQAVFSEFGRCAESESFLLNKGQPQDAQTLD